MNDYEIIKIRKEKSKNGFEVLEFEFTDSDGNSKKPSGIIFFSNLEGKLRQQAENEAGSKEREKIKTEIEKLDKEIEKKELELNTLNEKNLEGQLEQKQADLKKLKEPKKEKEEKKGWRKKIAAVSSFSLWGSKKENSGDNEENIKNKIENLEAEIKGKNELNDSIKKDQELKTQLNSQYNDLSPIDISFSPNEQAKLEMLKTFEKGEVGQKFKISFKGRSTKFNSETNALTIEEIEKLETIELAEWEKKLIKSTLVIEEEKRKLKVDKTKKEIKELLKERKAEKEPAVSIEDLDNKDFWEGWEKSLEKLTIPEINNFYQDAKTQIKAKKEELKILAKPPKIIGVIKLSSEGKKTVESIKKNQIKVKFSLNIEEKIKELKQQKSRENNEIKKESLKTQLDELERDLENGTKEKEVEKEIQLERGYIYYQVDTRIILNFKDYGEEKKVKELEKVHYIALPEESKFVNEENEDFIDKHKEETKLSFKFRLAECKVVKKIPPW
ncbi:hypothetical protein [endosymbiont GvMRE of Glomus versiforme]|uniref:hypothetical protein n=1 Tax=endosymbiont GvMRE of Glomus versiforme TaxID=2039283 RepID=UPI000EF07361|nr:hypothetical protein [endosymbiont GvMRE of Glomus versiforme]RHZ35984.1 hypothetical protein GvMRE_Ic3g59 [endosymbiont GvMRE of Glomus versiforme]